MGTAIRKCWRWAVALLPLTLAAMHSTVSLGQTAPSINYTSADATSVKPVQLGYYASAHTNCTSAPLPAVGVVEAPKLGTLTIRLGVLTTSKIAGCPSLKTPVQVVFYQARVGVFGTDHVIYQVTTADGKVDGYDVTINVKEATKLPVPNSEKPI